MHRAGFTLLELIVVLAVTGALMALAAPHVGALRDASAVRAGIAEVGGAFSLARQMAIGRREPVAVVLDTARGALELRAGGMVIEHHALRAAYGIALGANRDSAVYDPRGFGFGLSNLTVTVTRGAFVDTLTMSRLGRVRW